MAKSVASKVLGIPWGAKGIVTEAERLQLHWVFDFEGAKKVYASVYIFAKLGPSQKP